MDACESSADAGVVVLILSKVYTDGTYPVLVVGSLNDRIRDRRLPGITYLVVMRNVCCIVRHVIVNLISFKYLNFKRSGLLQTLLFF